VATVNQLAARNPDIEVIEWSFTCLAWLFKYLSKLLVPDLRPMYDLMAPLLGKEHQKLFVSRFTAEALSFLIRRASVAYHQDKGPLQIIVKHILGDLCRSKDLRTLDLFKDGVMTLFAEAIKGVNGNLSPSGDMIFLELISCSLEINDVESSASMLIREILRGVLTSILHFTNSATFKPVMDIVLKQMDQSKEMVHNSRVSVCMQLITLAVTVKRGSRIEEWSSILQSIAAAISQITTASAPSCSEAIPDVLASLAVSHQTCPVDTAISHTKLFDIVGKGLWKDHFLGFCDLYAELGNDRFQSFLLPAFQR
jgi:U3 small nucleolar RNA-associated protein 20